MTSPSLPTTSSSAHQRASRANPPLAPWRAALFAWALVALVMVVKDWPLITRLGTLDPDDALRLIQVRDLIGGQGWWDIIQHRINPAGGGGLMHWSRIVDTPIALGIIALTPLFGQAIAEIIVLAAWPLLLLLALMLLAARVFSLVASRRVAALATALIATDFIILFQFAPMRIDHHGWQIVLTLALLDQMLRPASARSGLLAGLVAATLLAISLEGLPSVVLFAAIMAFAWAWTGVQAARHRLVAYLTALGTGGLLLQLATRGPAAVMQHWCDALSLPYLAALAAAAIAVGCAAPLLDRVAANRIMRFAMLGIAGAASGAALLAIEPTCAAGPFGTLDPLVVEYWYNNIHEGLPIWTEIDPTFAFVLVPMLVGLAGTFGAWRAARADVARRNWSVMLAVCGGTTLLALLVLRAGAVAHLFALPGCAWLIVHGWHRVRRIRAAVPRVLASVLILCLPPPMAGAALALFLRDDAAAATAGEGAVLLNSESCIAGSSLAALNALPPQTIMAPLDLGPHLLQRTQHSVTATSHHRNNAVMAQTIAAFVGDPAQAHARARAMGATLLVICPDAIETGNFVQADGTTLADMLVANTTPDWLQPVQLPPGATLRIWHIAPQAASATAAPPR